MNRNSSPAIPSSFAFVAIVLGSCVCTTNLSPVQAAVIYSQTTPSQPLGAFTSTDRPAYQKIADNFLLNGTGSATIRSLRFIGGFGKTQPPPQNPPPNPFPPHHPPLVFFFGLGGAPGLSLPGG